MKVRRKMLHTLVTHSKGTNQMNKKCMYTERFSSLLIVKVGFLALRVPLSRIGPGPVLVSELENTTYLLSGM